MKLRTFTCLSRGDRFSFDHNNRIFDVSVVETRPANAVSITECDMNVEFDAPEGYVEPPPTPGSSAALRQLGPIEERDPHSLELPPDVQAPQQAGAFVPFAGGGQRLDGKVKGAASSSRLIPQPHDAGSSAASSVNASLELPQAADAAGGTGLPDLNYMPGNLTFHR